WARSPASRSSRLACRGCGSYAPWCSGLDCSPGFTRSASSRSGSWSRSPCWASCSSCGSASDSPVVTGDRRAPGGAPCSAASWAPRADDSLASRHGTIERSFSMVVGVGIDVVAIERISRALAEAAGDFEARVFTPAEREACRQRADKAQALGARFAAKEACFKALGRGLGQGLAFQQIEVTADESGRPELRLSGAAAARAGALGVTRVHESLRHDIAA